jgi:hypothetical protein
MKRAFRGCDKTMREVQVKRSSEKETARTFIVISLVLLSGFSIALAQKPWAALEAPPTGVARPADVLRPGHLGRMIGNVELMIHFYHDLIGLGLLGPRGGPRP